MPLRYLFLLLLPFFSQAQMDTSRVQKDIEQFLGLKARMHRSEVEARWGSPNTCIEIDKYCMFGPNNALRMWFNEQQQLRKVSLQILNESDAAIAFWVGQHADQISILFDLFFVSPKQIKSRLGQATKEDMIGAILVYHYYLPELKYSLSFENNICVQLTLAWY